MGDDIRIFAGSECRKVHLPTIWPASGTYTIRTGRPITIEPGFQEIEITIALVQPPSAGTAGAG